MPVITRRASENARRRSVYDVETTTERNAGTTPGMEDECRDAGRLQGCRTTAGMQELEQRRSGCRGRVASGTAIEQIAGEKIGLDTGATRWGSLLAAAGL